MRIAPGERMEVLVDFSGGDDPILMSSNGLKTKILDFVRDDTLSARISRLPERLDAEEPFFPTGTVTTRKFGLNMGGSSTGQVKPGAMEAAAHSGHGGHAAHAALIGAATYAVYDFTSLSILKKYEAKIAVADTLWGGVLFAITFSILKRLGI
jgi:hypothetical protein